MVAILQTPTSWVQSSIYNQFPNVFDARQAVTRKTQEDLTNKLSSRIEETPELASLISKVGTSITHGHFFSGDKQVVAGSVTSSEQGNSLLSKPQDLRYSISPTTWTALNGHLVRTEGVLNPSPELQEIAIKVEENADKLLPFLKQGEKDKPSQLSLSIDPRIVIATKDTDFMETTEEDGSLLRGVKDVNKDSEQSDLIPTYLSTQPSDEGNSDNSVTTKCRGWCQEVCGGNLHYVRHHMVKA